MKNILVAFIAILILYGCGPVYKKNDGRGVGYTDRKIGDGIYELRFTGDSFTKMAEVEKYWHRRAQELCGKYGFTGTPTNSSKTISNIAFSAGTPYQDTYTLHTAEGVVKCNK